MKKYICLLASVALFAACEKKEEVVTPGASPAPATSTDTTTTMSPAAAATASPTP